MEKYFNYYENIHDQQLLIHNNSLIVDALFSCTNTAQVESSIMFAKYINEVGINKNNYLIFLKLVETNNRWVVDALIGKRNPDLLFSSITPNKNLIKKVFSILSFWHPNQIYSKALSALIGIIQNAYFDPDEGYNIHRIKIMDLNTIGKYLDQDKDSDFISNKIILDVLDRLCTIGEYHDDIDKQILAKHSFDIRIAYFDNTKKLEDVIPQVLLVRLDRNETEVPPSKSFLSMLQ